MGRWYIVEMSSPGMVQGTCPTVTWSSGVGRSYDVHVTEIVSLRLETIINGNVNDVSTGKMEIHLTEDTSGEYRFKVVLSLVMCQ